MSSHAGLYVVACQVKDDLAWTYAKSYSSYGAYRTRLGKNRFGEWCEVEWSREPRAWECFCGADAFREAYGGQVIRLGPTDREIREALTGKCR